MKIHKHLTYAVVEILQDIFASGYYADKALEYRFKQNKKWGARDRRFVAEAVYDISRWWRRLWFAADKSENANNPWPVVVAWLVTKNYDLPDIPQIEKVSSEKIKDRFNNAKSPAIRLSLPDWLFVEGERELGPEWEAAVEAMNDSAKVVLRCNSLKLSPAELVDKLKKEEIDSEILNESAVVLKQRKNVFRTEAFASGLFEVQDAASQMVAPFLNPQPGERVIDACAGAGGKTLHLAALMRNKGRIIALDTEDRKLEELRKRVSRAGVDIVETRTAEGKAVKRLHESCDRLLLDVPCTGTGVWKRNPDAKWKMSLESIARVREQQKAILSSYSKMLKPGGTLVYSTCSIWPSENRAIVEEFVQATGWTLHDQRKIMPQEGFDGFYMAKLVRPLQ